MLKLRQIAERNAEPFPKILAIKALRAKYREYYYQLSTVCGFQKDNEMAEWRVTKKVLDEEHIFLYFVYAESPQQVNKP